MTVSSLESARDEKVGMDRVDQVVFREVSARLEVEMSVLRSVVGQGRSSQGINIMKLVGWTIRLNTRRGCETR